MTTTERYYLNECWRNYRGIKSGDLFRIEGDAELRKCLGTEDGYIWYDKEGQMELGKVDPIYCTLVQRFISDGKWELVEEIK